MHWPLGYPRLNRVSVELQIRPSVMKPETDDHVTCQGELDVVSSTSTLLERSNQLAMQAIWPRPSCWSASETATSSPQPWLVELISSI